MFNTCKFHAKLGGDAKPKSIAKFKDFLDSTKERVWHRSPPVGSRGKASLGDLGDDTTKHKSK